MNGRRRRSLSRFGAIAAAISLSLLSGLTGSAFGAGTAQINGSGSTWAYNAVNAWIGEVSAQGLRVTFTPNGSAAGRQDFANRAVDFAVSDIGYQGTDPLTGTNDTSSGRRFAYVPMVAGGTAFPYHLTVAGQSVRNLRLSGATLAGIFTGHITNWDDSHITQDNNGRKFPSIPIVPVVHSEGSGTSYQFSAYLAQDFPSLWGPFAGHDKPTEYWPSGKSGQVAQSGSDQMMNYIASGSGQGTIGFDEYSYAIAKNIPVAKIENQAGYFTLPTQYNVAVSLTQAIINTDRNSPNYLLQDLKNVYGYSDKRTYPLSSYSYGVIPTGSNSQDSHMSTPKRQTLADFLYTSICQGQGAIGQIGYSALPINLVQRGFQQIDLLKKADSDIDLKNLSVNTCGNPTFVAGKPNVNHLAQVAPDPPLCDEAGHGPCTIANDYTGATAGSAGSPGKSDPNTGGHVGAGSSPSGSGGSPSGSGGSPSGSSSGTNPSGGTGTTGGSGTHIDPATGQVIGNSTSGTSGDGSTALAEAEPVTLGNGQGSGTTLAVLAAVLFLAAIVVPPVVARRWRPRRRS